MTTIERQELTYLLLAREYFFRSTTGVRRLSLIAHSEGLNTGRVHNRDRMESRLVGVLNSLAIDTDSVVEVSFMM